METGGGSVGPFSSRQIYCWMDLLLDVGTLRWICMPWIATNRYGLVWRVLILVGL